MSDTTHREAQVRPDQLIDRIGNVQKELNQQIDNLLHNGWQKSLVGNYMDLRRDDITITINGSTGIPSV